MRETQLTGWAIGLEPLPDNPYGVTHRLVLVDAPAARDGSVAAGREGAEQISVIMDSDGLRALHGALADAVIALDAGERPTIEVAAALPQPMGRSARRAAERAARKG